MSLGLQRHRNAFRGAQETAWMEMSRAIDTLANRAGVEKLQLVDVTVPQPATGLRQQPAEAPPQCQFAVSGQDGKFTIEIANPQDQQPLSTGIAQGLVWLPSNAARNSVIHNLQSCETVDFDAANGLTDYGDSSQLTYHFQNPNVTLFWRVRSSYDGTNWNQWQIYGNATIACGPIGVYSGLLRTAALVQASASYTPTTNPLTAVTGTPSNDATIEIASFQVQYPFGLLSYNAGSINPLDDDTSYFVYTLDPTYSGGALPYYATESNPTISAYDSMVYLGPITTPVHGGGGTSGGQGGGGGPCFTGNTLVITKRGIKKIADIEAGDEILTMRGWRKVRKLLVHEYDGPMARMSCGEYVTLKHHFWVGVSHAWRPAREIWDVARAFAGWVFNLEIEGDGSDEEQCYTLANGWIAHNQVKPA
jgi:hypothetical protein